jgi:hypothetical protein
MDSNQALISRYITELNKRNYSIIDELVAPEVVVGVEKLSRDQYKQQIQDRITKYPDYKVEILKHETKKDLVTLSWHRTGTNQETGEKLDEKLTSEYRITNGMICEAK